VYVVRFYCHLTGCVIIDFDCCIFSFSFVCDIFCGYFGVLLNSSVFVFSGTEVARRKDLLVHGDSGGVAVGDTFWSACVCDLVHGDVCA
jgi:hypothetical protein